MSPAISVASCAQRAPRDPIILVLPASGITSMYDKLREPARPTLHARAVSNRHCLLHAAHVTLPKQLFEWLVASSCASLADRVLLQSHAAICTQACSGWAQGRQ